MRLAGARYRAIVSILLVMPLLAAGCASPAWRNAVPAYYVESGAYYRPRSQQEPINFVRLGQDSPRAHLLGPRDTLGIYVEGVLGKADEAPPVHHPERGNIPPSIGFPIPVREDGTIALPLVPLIQVEGLTLAQAEYAIYKAYVVDRKILREGRDRILVTLMRPRTYQVLVVREDTTDPSMGARRNEKGLGELTIGSGRRGAVHIVELPAYENDVLHALGESGGLPGLDAKNEVTILRRGFDAAGGPDAYLQSFVQEVDGQPTGVEPRLAQADGGALPQDIGVPQPAMPNLVPERVAPEILGQLPEMPGRITPYGFNPNVIRIPLRAIPGEPLPELTQEDVLLNTGDVVFIQSRDAEVFYTGGIIEGGQHPVPRDYDLDVLGAIAMAGGSIASAVGGAGGQLRGGVGSIFPPTRVVVLRQVDGQQVGIRINLKTALVNPAERILIKPDDFIILEYSPTEVVMNTVLSTVTFSVDVNQLLQ